MALTKKEETAHHKIFKSEMTFGFNSFIMYGKKSRRRNPYNKIKYV